MKSLGNVRQLLIVFVMKFRYCVWCFVYYEDATMYFKIFIIFSLTLDVLWIVYWIIITVNGTRLALLNKRDLVVWDLYLYVQNFQIHFQRCMIYWFEAEFRM